MKAIIFLLLISFEVNMLEVLLVTVYLDFVEIVHVQLTDKRGQVAVFEESGEDGLSKIVSLLNDEAVTCFIPTDQIVEGWVLYYYYFD